MGKKAPSVILSAYLMHHVYQDLIGNPFFFLDSWEMESNGSSPTSQAFRNLGSELYALYLRMGQGESFGA